MSFSSDAWFRGVRHKQRGGSWKVRIQRSSEAHWDDHVDRVHQRRRWERRKRPWSCHEVSLIHTYDMGQFQQDLRVDQQRASARAWLLQSWVGRRRLLRIWRQPNLRRQVSDKKHHQHVQTVLTNVRSMPWLSQAQHRAEKRQLDKTRLADLPRLQSDQDCPKHQERLPCSQKGRA